jgi:threonine 3-dehydrogenase
MVTDLRTNDFKDAVSVDAMDAAAAETAIQQFKPTVIYHLAALLSGTCEQHPTTGLQVNITTTHNVLEAARRHNLAVFGFSTAATFGPDTAKSPKLNDVLNPSGIYGITKVHMELLGAYYRRTFGVDFRAIKILTVVSDPKAGGGLAAFTVNIIYDLLTTGRTVVPLEPSARFPWMHEEDVVKSILDLMRASK